MILWGQCHPSMPFSRSPRHLERLAAFIDGLLERAEHRRVSVHVRGCEPCRQLLDEARALLAAEGASRQV